MPAVAKVERHVADALARAPSFSPAGVAPTAVLPASVLTGVTMDMAMSCEETFGPVAGINRFGTDAEAVAVANDTPYGLSAYFYTQTSDAPGGSQKRSSTGSWASRPGFISSEVAPFGGMKESGIGREGSSFGVDDWVDSSTSRWAESGRRSRAW